MRDGVDIAVVGAGVVGCAAAAVLARAGASVAVLEAAPREGTGVSSRNSGVIHSGLYYPAGSIKARTCVRGQALLYGWCDERGVPCARTGKLVVARDPAEEAALHALRARAAANGARDVRLVTPAEAAALEPALRPVTAALWCPWSGVVDPHALTRSLRADAEAHGALVAFGAAVTAAERLAAGWRLHTARGPLDAARVVNAAGLHADEVAALLGAPGHPIHPCRGDWYRLRTATRWRRLVYPVRAPGAAGLGVHLTLDLAGGVRLGPDVRWVARKDDLGPPRDGFEPFLAAARRLLGPVAASDLTWDGAGLRPKLRAPDDPEDRDFLLLEEPAGALHLLGIESPGLTAALALAEEVAARLLG